MYSLLAALIVVFHVAYILFVLVGGALLLKWPRVAWAHVPAIVWAIYVQAAGAICPLTPLENALRERAGASAYSTGFIEHYIVPLIYPVHLTRDMQIYGAVFVFAVNALIYWSLWRRKGVA